MELPFTQEQFAEVFRIHNEILGFGVVGLFAAGSFVLLAAREDKQFARRTSFIVLSAMWILNAVLYHFVLFSRINPLAPVFGAMFLLQAALLLLAAWRTAHGDRPQPAIVRGSGFLIALYGLVIYWILVNLRVGFELTPAFGAAPCPTVIFTFGILLMMQKPVPWWLLVVPSVWAVIGGSAAILLHMPEDFGLIAAGVLGVALTIYSRLVKSAPAAN
jgi:hypothetical protein